MQMGHFRMSKSRSQVGLIFLPAFEVGGVLSCTLSIGPQGTAFEEGVVSCTRASLGSPYTLRKPLLSHHETPSSNKNILQASLMLIHAKFKP